MPYPDLPIVVKQMTASSEMRWKHRYWHLVKNERVVNDPRNRGLIEALARLGWTARLTGEPGAGIDFLAMHRQMIHHVDQMLAGANDPDWPKVVGWDSIPKSDDDKEWPEPDVIGLDDRPNWPTDPELLSVFEAIAWARSPRTKAEMFGLEANFRDNAYLSDPNTTLDTLGHEIEVTVHNWMHMRFAAMPPTDRSVEDVSNDYLGDPFSSHVNPYFWKLHGWIDDCIGLWETARGEQADLSQAWQAPDIAPPWNELEIEAEMMAMAERTQRGALFGNVQAFRTPENVLSSAMKRVQGANIR